LSRVHHTLAVALVGASQDPEETVVTPGCTPRVGNNPVWQVGSAINTPTNDLDGVTTGQTTRQMSVDTRSVGEEVLVDSEAHLDGTVVHDVLLHGLNVLLVKELDGGWVHLSNVKGVTVLASSHASLNVATTRGVWGTLLRDGTFSGQELPGQVQVATIATVVALVAGDNVLWGQLNIGVGLGGNTESVGHGRGSRDSPAGTAAGLISDWANTSWVSLSEVKLFRDGSLDNRVVLLNVHGLRNWQEGTEHLLHLFHGHALELLVGLSLPGSLWVVVDLGDHVLVIDQGVAISIGQEHSNDSEDGDSLHFVIGVDGNIVLSV